MEAMVIGNEDKVNEMLYYCPPAGPIQNIIYFPGDVQNLRQIMEGEHSDIKQWKDYCLESTLDILKTKFPDSSVWIIRPHTVLRNTFSCFRNFLNCNIVGAPIFDSKPNAIPHLYHLMSNAINLAPAASLDVPVVLVGFSKGCVVLNQIMYELNNYLPLISEQQGAKEETEIQSFLGRISDIYWLDSGHSGESQCYIIERDVLEQLSLMNLQRIHVHVTPHQMEYPQRPWINQEEREFVDTSRDIGLNVVEKYHFNDEPRSFANHFKLLKTF